MNNIFEIIDVQKTFQIRQGIWQRRHFFDALKAVNLKLEKGKVYGLVGESGSGKSTLAKLLIGLQQPSSGEIRFENKNLKKWLQKRKSYAQKVQMIFQNPYLSLDPEWTVQAILEEGIQQLNGKERRKRISEVMANMRLPMDYLSRRPAALSGGERQRIALARALALRPEYLILDEPTSQLDVSTQATLIELLQQLKKQMPGGMLFISHDLALASQIADEIIVLYNGRVEEQGKKSVVLKNSKSDYTQQLLAALPSWPPRFN